MSRKSISDEVQKDVLTKSRRRCCVCFWLEGKDEVQKGQIAHLDQNNENSDEENLAFLCFDHHDQFDSTTRQSKNLTEKEVRHWRDELYREIQYRFAAKKSTDFELKALGVVHIGPEDQCSVKFRLKNTGDTTVRRSEVSFRLPDKIDGEKPESPPEEMFGGFMVSSAALDPFGTHESRQDFFEPHGRVAMVSPIGPMASLPPGHAVEFTGLGLRLGSFVQQASIEFDFRVDAEDAPPVLGKVKLILPTKPEELLSDD